MPSGDRKRRDAGFKKGHKCLYRKHTCDPEPGTSTASKDIPSDQPDTGYEPPTLRHRNLKREEQNGNYGNRIVNLDKMIYMINAVYSEHKKHRPVCRSINLGLDSEHKMGLGSQLTFTCHNCSFKSSAMKTYETRMDNRSAAVNMMLASCLQDTAIGVEKANLMLVSMDIPPPTRSHMQTLVNEASQNTQELNEKDMAVKRQAVIQHNRETGAQDPFHLDLSMDGRYNTRGFVSSYKPGQGSSQAYGVAIENHTSYKYIVNLAVQNKLCWTGAYLRNKGFDVKCPDGHSGCTATMPYMQPHSERQMGFSIAKQLCTDDIMVRTITTDGDASAHLGIQDFYDQLGNAWNVARQADPHHLGSTLMKKVRAAKWSKEMFPGCTTILTRQKAATALGRDVKARCSAIIEKLRKRSKNNIESQLKCLPAILDATLHCYGGNCSFCPHGSLVCDGQGSGDWWLQSPFLKTHNIDRLKMTENDRELFKNILEVRLSEHAVMSVSSNTSTQKCEAFNRGVSSILPKEVNMSRNYPGRLSSKTMQLNNTVEICVQKKVSSITGHPLSPKASTYLKSISKRTASHRSYQKTEQFKASRRKKRASLEYAYHVARATGQYKDEYKKGQLDELSLQSHK